MKNFNDAEIKCFELIRSSSDPEYVFKHLEKNPMAFTSLTFLSVANEKIAKKEIERLISNRKRKQKIKKHNPFLEVK